jgi:hypothetical protein
MCGERLVETSERRRALILANYLHGQANNGATNEGILEVINEINKVLRELSDSII